MELEKLKSDWEKYGERLSDTTIPSKTKFDKNVISYFDKKLNKLILKTNISLMLIFVIIMIMMYGFDSYIYEKEVLIPIVIILFYLIDYVFLLISLLRCNVAKNNILKYRKIVDMIKLQEKVELIVLLVITFPVLLIFLFFMLKKIGLFENQYFYLFIFIVSATFSFIYGLVLYKRNKVVIRNLIQQLKEEV